MGHCPNFTECELKWLAQGHSGHKWWMGIQNLASLTSKPALLMTHRSPHLWTGPHTQLLENHRSGKVTLETWQENNGSCKLHGQRRVWFFSPSTVSTVNSYALSMSEEQSGISSVTTDALFVTCQVWSMDHEHQNHLGSRVNYEDSSALTRPTQLLNLWGGGAGDALRATASILLRSL